MRRLLVLLVLLLTTAAWGASDTQPGGTSTSTDWTNPDSVYTDNNEFATKVNDLGYDSMYVRNFGFSIPTDATIDSIFVRWRGYHTDGVGSRRRVDVAPTINGTSAKGDWRENIDQGTTEAAYEVTGLIGALWQTTWTYTQVNATSFGLLFRNASNQKTDSHFIDLIEMRVVYTEAAAGGDEAILETHSVTGAKAQATPGTVGRQGGP